MSPKLKSRPIIAFLYCEIKSPTNSLRVEARRKPRRSVYSPIKISLIPNLISYQTFSIPWEQSPSTQSYFLFTRMATTSALPMSRSFHNRRQPGWTTSLSSLKGASSVLVITTITGSRSNKIRSRWVILFTTLLALMLNATNHPNKSSGSRHLVFVWWRSSLALCYLVHLNTIKFH